MLMAMTETTIKNSINACMAEFYKKYIDDSHIGREDKNTMRVLKKLKILYNLSMWMDFEESEYEKIFCFIAECKHKV